MKRVRIALLAIVAAACFAGVAHADTSILLGSNQTSWTHTATVGAGYQNAIAYEVTATATASTLTANVYFSTHDATETIGVYDNNAGGSSSGTDVPGTLLGSATMPAGSGWKVATFTGVSLVQGTSYWIAELQTTSGSTNTWPADSDLDADGSCLDEPNVSESVSVQSSLPSSWPTALGGSSHNGQGPSCLHGFVVKG